MIVLFQLLLEYGADLTIVNNKKKRVNELPVSDEFQQTLTSKRNEFS
jgi:hypothetical protein